MKARMDTRIKLIHMEDPYPLPSGSIGTLLGLDYNGDLEVAWDCGSSLKLIPGVDVGEELYETEFD